MIFYRNCNRQIPKKALMLFGPENVPCNHWGKQPADKSCLAQMKYRMSKKWRWFNPKQKAIVYRFCTTIIATFGTNIPNSLVDRHFSTSLPAFNRKLYGILLSCASTVFEQYHAPNSSQMVLGLVEIRHEITISALHWSDFIEFTQEILGLNVGAFAGIAVIQRWLCMLGIWGHAPGILWLFQHFFMAKVWFSL